MSHCDLPPPAGWYDEQMADDALLGPDAAEAKWFPHEARRAGRVFCDPTRRATDDAAAGIWTGAFMDCLLERRGYSLIPRMTPKTIAQIWREAVATVERKSA